MDYPAMVSCRMTDEDLGLLLGRAEALGMGRSEYLRTLIRIPTAPTGGGECVYVIDNKTLARMAVELVRWGRHYNQAVKALNTIALFVRRLSAPSAADMQRLLEKAEKSLEEVEEGRRLIEYVLTEIARSTTVGGS